MCGLVMHDSTLKGKDDRFKFVNRAQRYARHHHEGQIRNGEAAELYITHAAEVASLVRALEGDAIAQSAAWLHDVVEDCSPTLMDVEAEFGGDRSRCG